jgi:predicted AAA+ superfamily ATPase
MIDRPLWKARLEAAWRKAPIAWLSGPRRTGKTSLARSLDRMEFLDCDLPSVAERLADPESFFRSVRTEGVVFDEVHQLPDPSRLLKIGADHFPKLRLLATGSSTLAATAKFRDTLTGRKRTIQLVPVLHEELPAFGIQHLPDRLLRGGLPPMLLADEPDPAFYNEWLDSYFARDVQELFRIAKRGAFLRMLGLLLRQSGGMLEVTRLAGDAEVSRPTALSWLDILEVTHVLHILRPYSNGGRAEVVAQPKVYGFDTGFVCHARGWDRLRAEDHGLLWEHLVLESLIAAGVEKVLYWRDKSQREVDFVVPRGREQVDAIECKWRPQEFKTRGLAAFRSNYPKGRNWVVSPIEGKSYERTQDGLTFTVLTPGELRASLQP